MASTVTKGLPSRSPPIHEENFNGGRTAHWHFRIVPLQGGFEQIAKRAGAVEQGFAEEVQAPGISCSTVGFSSRISPVIQSRSISLRRSLEQRLCVRAASSAGFPVHRASDRCGGEFQER